MSQEYKEILDAISDIKLEVREIRTIVENSVELRFKNHEDRISKLENTQAWVVKTILGIVISAVVGAVMVL